MEEYYRLLWKCVYSVWADIWRKTCLRCTELKLVFHTIWCAKLESVGWHILYTVSFTFQLVKHEMTTKIKQKHAFLTVCRKYHWVVIIYISWFTKIEQYYMDVANDYVLLYGFPWLIGFVVHFDYSVNKIMFERMWRDEWSIYHKNRNVVYNMCWWLTRTARADGYVVGLWGWGCARWVAVAHGPLPLHRLLEWTCQKLTHVYPVLKCRLELLGIYLFKDSHSFKMRMCGTVKCRPTLAYRVLFEGNNISDWTDYKILLQREIGPMLF